MQHWVTICNIHVDGKIYLYDSLPMTTLLDEIIDLYGEDSTSVKVTIPVVQ